MGKVRFIQQETYSNFLTCGLYNPNYTYHLIDEQDKILYTIEETSNKMMKFFWTDEVTSYEATLYLGLKSKELVTYKKKFKVPSCFCNYSRPEVEIIDWVTNTKLGKICNPAPKFFSCKGYNIEVRDNSDNMVYELYNDDFWEWNLWCPLPLWKCKQSEWENYRTYFLWSTS